VRRDSLFLTFPPVQYPYGYRAIPGWAVQSIRNFELVHTLAEHRHFGRAAAALGVSQPSLTRSLNRLEGLVGGALFERQGVTPTVFGEIVLKHGRVMLGAFDELTRELTLVKGLDLGELSVAMAFFPADISGYAAAAELSRQHPNVSIELRIMDWPRAKEAVLTGACDLAFADIGAAANDPSFDVYPIRVGPLRIFCGAGHPLAGAAKVTFDDITRYPWVGPTLAGDVSRHLPMDDRPCWVRDKATGRVRPRILVESFGAAKRVVLMGEALSAGMPFQIEREISAGEFVVLPIDTPFIALNYGFVLKRDRMTSPAAKAFMKMVRKIEGAIR